MRTSLRLLLAVVIVIGLRLGAMTINLISLRSDLIGGLVLIVVALSFIFQELWTSAAGRAQAPRASRTGNSK